MSAKTHMAVDQYGQTEHDLGPDPKKGLLERLGKRKAEEMMVDHKDGTSHHIGWVIGDRWFTVYEVKPMGEGRAS